MPMKANECYGTTAADNPLDTNTPMKANECHGNDTIVPMQSNECYGELKELRAEEYEYDYIPSRV